MTYQAIARTYRPRVFGDLRGQEHVVHTLQNALSLDRIHHAFLFTGARGVGKTSAARILARALQCESGPAPEPCNECSQCAQIEAGNHPDVIEMDGASNNSVDDVRAIIERIGYAPQMGRSTIYVIDEVHMLSQAAFNALLKTLEEPPPHVVFIFATTDPQRIPETVASRMQRFDFRLLTHSTVVESLAAIAKREGHEMPEGSLHLIAREAGGSMRDAQSLLDQVLCFAEETPDEKLVAELLGFVDRALLFDVAQAVSTGDGATALDGFARVQEYGVPVSHFCRELLEILRHLSVAATVPNPDRLLDLPAEECVRVKELAAGSDKATLSRRFDILAQAYEGIARSEHAALRAEMALLRACRVDPVIPVQHLVDRLIALQKEIESGSGSRPRESAEPTKEPDPAPAPQAPLPVEEVLEAPPAVEVSPETPVSARGLEERWRAAVEQQNPATRSLLDNTVLAGLEGDDLQLGVSGLFAEQLQTALDEGLGEQLSQAMGVSSVRLVEGQKSETPAALRRQERERAIEESYERLRSHPVVDQVRAVFPGARLRSVHSDLEDA